MHLDFPDRDQKCHDCAQEHHQLKPEQPPCETAELAEAQVEGRSKVGNGLVRQPLGVGSVDRVTCSTIIVWGGRIHSFGTAHDLRMHAGFPAPD